jgi:acetoacetate decarboxylase
MRFVRGSEEISDLMRRWAEPAFLDSRVLSIAFETDPALIAAVLPPGLEPEKPGIASVFVATFGASNCVGPFDGAALNVRARHGDIPGNYCVTMPMSTDTAIIFGRELYGEPKKLARIALQREGNRVTGTVERPGITYIRLTADLTEQGESGEGEGSTFHVKFTPRADGSGLDGDPLLIHVRSRSVVRHQERGTGTVEFAESPTDPVADFPVRRVLSASYTEGDTFTFGRTLARLDPVAFLPYAFGKMDPMDAFLASPVAAAVG